MLIDKEACNFFILKYQKSPRKPKKGGRHMKIKLYILKNSLRYAFIEPKWIVEHGEIGVVDAWGSRPAYRVPKRILRAKKG